MNNMFNHNYLLTSVYVSDSFSTDSVTSTWTIFTSSSKIRWWNWTKYNSTKLWLEYAKADSITQSWYFINVITVNFITNWWTDVEPQYLHRHDKITQPTTIKEWYEIQWRYTDPGLTHRWNFDDWVQVYTELYADWRHIWDKTITFKIDDETDYTHINAAYNTPITAPANPTKIWYTFIWWDKAIPARMPANDMTITALWSVNQHEISFDSAGWTYVAPIHQDYGTPIIAPANPTKTWYTFLWWIPALPSTMPAEHLFLVADRVVNHYTITFETDGWSAIAPIIQDYGTSVTPPADPTKDGYTFEGWDVAVPSIMPSYDMTITALWKQNGWNRSWWWGRGWNGGDKWEDKPDNKWDDKWDDKWGDEHGSADDENDPPFDKGGGEWNEPEGYNDWDEDIPPSSPLAEGGQRRPEKEYKPETIDAHRRAYENWLTEYENIDDAKLSRALRRSEMAKISSIFATDFLDKIPDESKQYLCSQYSDMRKSNNEMKFFITQSCELGYMWYESNGVDLLTRFRPYTSLTLAEASTVLSRILRWTEYALDNGNWYKWHLHAAYESELIDDISKPFSNITREEAFVMLYRVYQKMEK